MNRQVDLNEISDGKRYHKNDMVRLGCNDCAGCSECCRNTGKTILLDPWDMYLLTTQLSQTFEQLMEKSIALDVVEGTILPHLQVAEDGSGCHFLSAEGRCSIHAVRPGFCRLFPLGRLYENGSFSYILQTQECERERRTKIKISKWLGIENLSRYESFVTEWHYFLKEAQEGYAQMSGEALRAWNLFLLQTFFVTPYQKEDFYGQFAERMNRALSRQKQPSHFEF